jgi:hypothetical protein
MAYRGEDLDLRTPQGVSPAPSDSFAQSDGGFVGNGRRERPGQGSGSRSAPIWVDDTVLDCCNYAFDVALAHRSAEVRLEHFVYALARIDTAAEVLESRGLPVAALRREMATFIATEIPIGLAAGKGTPRRSEALEDLLRVAASVAYRRQAPVGVPDVLYALAESGLEIAGMPRLRQLLQRSSGATLLDPLPAEALQDRMRVPYYVSEALRAPATELPQLAIGSQGTAQGSRLELLEHAIRTITSELTNERKIISGALHDLQRELMAQREETSRLGGITQDKIQALFGDRLQSLEQTLISTRAVPDGELSLLQDRIITVERTVQQEFGDVRTALDTLLAKPDPADISPLAHRLDVIEEAVLSRDTPDRLRALEEGFAAERNRLVAVEEASKVKADEFTGSLQRLPADVVALVQPGFTESIEGLSATLGGHIAKAEDAHASSEREFTTLHDTLGKIGDAVGQELADVHDAVAKVSNNQHALATALEIQKQDTDKAFALIAQRIDSLEKAAEGPARMLENLSLAVERMNTLTIERYYRRNRFWYWLFGTDDWLGSSWPSQSARIARELAALKTPKR